MCSMYLCVCVCIRGGAERAKQSANKANLIIYASSKQNKAVEVQSKQLKDTL